MQLRIVVLGAGYAGMLAALRLSGKARGGDITLGSRTDLDNVPGAREYAVPIESPQFKAKLAQLALTGGRRLVVGGGLTGIEAATEIAETYYIPSSALSTRYSVLSPQSYSDTCERSSSAASSINSTKPSAPSGGTRNIMNESSGW